MGSTWFEISCCSSATFIPTRGVVCRWDSRFLDYHCAMSSKSFSFSFLFSWSHWMNDLLFYRENQSIGLDTKWRSDFFLLNAWLACSGDWIGFVRHSFLYGGSSVFHIKLLWNPSIQDLHSLLTNLLPSFLLGYSSVFLIISSHWFCVSFLFLGANACMWLPTHDCAVFAVSQHQLPSNTLLVTAVTKRSIYISEVVFSALCWLLYLMFWRFCDFSALEPKRNVFGTIVFYVFV